MDINYLNGKKIGITAVDLEQKEHRGIAAVNKSLIQLLSKYGAEIYLITSRGAKRSKIFGRPFIKKKLLEEIYISDVLSTLQEGINFRGRFMTDYIYATKLIIILSLKTIKLIFSGFKLSYKIFKLNKYHKLINIFDNRLEYINDISGLIVSKNIFDFCRMSSMRIFPKPPILPIKKSQLDLIITSSPLSIRSNSKKYTNIIQLIHDTIPIQVSSHPENPIYFYNKLKDAHRYSSCVYVSNDSKRSVRDILEIKDTEDHSNDLLYPLPSLSLELLNEAKNIKNLRSINKPFILFNSSIVNRKRVEKAISLFKRSNLVDNNFLLCIAGKLHKSKYCDYIQDICKDNQNILLLDYVNELEKNWLFLNASLLISTSTAEGFGVPILDALSINLPCLATNLPTFREIKAFTPTNKLTLVKQNQDLIWIENLNIVKNFNIEDLDNKLDRIDHFNKFFNKLESQTLLKVNSYLD